MRLHIITCLAAACVVESLLPDIIFGSEIIPSWDTVYKELSIEVINPPFERFWTNSQTLRRLVAETNVPAMLDLMAQPSRNPAPVAAYFALREIDTNTPLTRGLQIATNTIPPATPSIIHVYQALSL